MQDPKELANQMCLDISNRHIKSITHSMWEWWFEVSNDAVHGKASYASQGMAALGPGSMAGPAKHMCKERGGANSHPISPSTQCKP